ncbi:MAG: hydantoinase/oxoprolinase N-terminal domain-containing protein [Roseobacter sp.]
MSFDRDPRLAIDIGGTFTDTALSDSDTIGVSTKTSTTHLRPVEAAHHVLKAAQARMQGSRGLIHGTTLATNALIEKCGANVANITRAGFRDILEIGYERRYSQCAINTDKSDLLVPRGRR